MNRRLLLAAVLSLVLAPVSLAWGKTFVIPHVLERSGTVDNTPFTFDTTMFATYTPTATGGGATGARYLYDRGTGQLMTALGGADVCNPCTFTLDATRTSASLRADDAIVAAGGFDAPVKLGFGIIVVGGADPDGVNLQGFVVNSHTMASEISVFGFDPQPILASSAARTFVLPHVLEKSGKTVLAGNEADQGGSTDTLLYPTYLGGLLGIPDSTATLQLTLYNNDGTRMLPGGAAFDFETVLSATNRSPLVALEDIIIDGGGFGGAIKEGYVGVSITGDAGNVAISGFVVNSHTGAFDLTLAPVPEPATAVLLMVGAVLGIMAVKLRRRRDDASLGDDRE